MKRPNFPIFALNIEISSTFFAFRIRLWDKDSNKGHAVHQLVLNFRYFYTELKLNAKS